MEMMTKAERDRVEQRLALLKANRPVVTQRIAEARALGDLKENGDYHAAREQQGIEEAEIRRLEERLSRAQIVEDGAGKGGTIVMLGSTVRIRDIDKKRVDTVKLVGEMSSEPPEGYDEVTVSSPMGESLLKARVGETIRVNAPRGVKRFEIVEIV
ncbi:MAG: transcription elongation factor GreA [Phycisphaerales bacterium]